MHSQRIFLHFPRMFLNFQLLGCSVATILSWSQKWSEKTNFFRSFKLEKLPHFLQCCPQETIFKLYSTILNFFLAWEFPDYCQSSWRQLMNGVLGRAPYCVLMKLSFRVLFYSRLAPFLIMSFRSWLPPADCVSNASYWRGTVCVSHEKSPYLAVPWFLGETKWSKAEDEDPVSLFLRVSRALLHTANCNKGHLVLFRWRLKLYQSHLVWVRATWSAPLCCSLKRQHTQEEVQAAPAGQSVALEDLVTNRTICSARGETKTYVQQRVKDPARQNQAIKADELQLRRQSDNHSPDTSLNHMKEEHGNRPLGACILQCMTMLK